MSAALGAGVDIGAAGGSGTEEDVQTAFMGGWELAGYFTTTHASVGSAVRFPLLSFPGPQQNPISISIPRVAHPVWLTQGIGGDAGGGGGDRDLVRTMERE
jgi:hypothetical protein